MGGGWADREDARGFGAAVSRSFELDYFGQAGLFRCADSGKLTVQNCCCSQEHKERPGRLITGPYPASCIAIHVDWNSIETSHMNDREHLSTSSAVVQPTRPIGALMSAFVAHVRAQKPSGSRIMGSSLTSRPELAAGAVYTPSFGR